MIIDTKNMQSHEFVNTMPAEACTEIGADQDDAQGEGGLISALVVAVLSVLFAVGVVHMLTGIWQ